MGHMNPPVGLFTPQGDLIPTARPPSREAALSKRTSTRVVFGLARAGGGTSHLGPFPELAQRHMQDDISGGAVLSCGT